MLSYRLSNRAEKDLENIAVYSIKNFGIKQARLYRDGLFKTFDMLCAFPMIGSNQNHIKKDVLRQVYEPHSIYYRIDANAIFILRILGPGKDPLRHLT
jgi:toxin ParE1/3/4